MRKWMSEGRNSIALECSKRKSTGQLQKHKAVRERHTQRLMERECKTCSTCMKCIWSKWVIFAQISTCHLIGITKQWMINCSYAILKYKTMVHISFHKHTALNEVFSICSNKAKDHQQQCKFDPDNTIKIYTLTTEETNL